MKSLKLSSLIDKWYSKTLKKYNETVLKYVFTSGHKVKFCRQWECFKPPVVYVIDCSKVVFLVWFFLCAFQLYQD